MSDVAHYLWRCCLAGVGKSTTLLIAFDRQSDTPRPKDIEHGKRRRCADPFPMERVQEALREDRVPGANWNEALSDRGARAAMVEDIARRVSEHFFEWNGNACRKLIVHGAWPRARAFTAADQKVRECANSEEGGEGCPDL